MTVSAPILLTILSMALVTYLTRIGGYLLLGDRVLPPRVAAIVNVAPGCVLLAVIAPHFTTGKPADLIALAITACAAARLPLLPTVLIGVASAGLLRHIIQ